MGWVGGGCAHLHCTVPQSQVVTSQAVSHLVTPTADTGDWSARDTPGDGDNISTSVTTETPSFQSDISSVIENDIDVIMRNNSIYYTKIL